MRRANIICCDACGSDTTSPSRLCDRCRGVATEPDWNRRGKRRRKRTKRARSKDASAAEQRLGHPYHGLLYRDDV